jgi:hypothetical protein
LHKETQYRAERNIAETQGDYTKRQSGDPLKEKLQAVVLSGCELAGASFTSRSHIIGPLPTGPASIHKS